MAYYFKIFNTKEGTMAGNVKVKNMDVNRASCGCEPTRKKASKKNWETPKLEDVSGKIMAQPYIRFT